MFVPGVSPRFQNPLPPPAVRRLRLGDVFLQGEPFYNHDIFRYTPNATTLELTKRTGKITPMLQYLASNPVSLPSLETLTISGCAGRWRRTCGFQELLMSRWSHLGVQYPMLGSRYSAVCTYICPVYGVEGVRRHEACVEAPIAPSDLMLLPRGCARGIAPCLQR